MNSATFDGCLAWSGWLACDCDRQRASASVWPKLCISASASSPDLSIAHCNNLTLSLVIFHPSSPLLDLQLSSSSGRIHRRSKSSVCWKQLPSSSAHEQHYQVASKRSYVTKAAAITHPRPPWPPTRLSPKTRSSLSRCRSATASRNLSCR